MYTNLCRILYIKPVHPTPELLKWVLFDMYCGDHFCFVIFRFLDVLAARKDPSGLSGEVLIDGAPQPSNFKCLSGYVVQVQQNTH